LGMDCSPENRFIATDFKPFRHRRESGALKA
jgi:hypothetical protein